MLEKTRTRTRIQTQTYRDQEKHIHLLIEILEARRIVRKAIPTIGAGRVSQEDALHLARKLRRHGRVVAHDVAVAGVGHEDELALGKGAEDLLEQELADRQGGGDVAEVERARVKGAARVRLVDEVHVVSRHLFGRGGEVVEVEIRDAARPVGVDLRHVHPGREGASEGVEEAFFGFVDFGDAEDVVDVVDDREAFRRYKVGSCISAKGSVGIDVQTLNLRCAVAGHEATARVLDRNEDVKVTFGCGGVRELDVLRPAVGRDGSTTSWLSRSTRSWRRFEVKGYVLIALLQDVDLRRKVPCL